jgi:RHS repeat-associated protein
MKRSLRGRGLFGRLLLCALLAGATSAPVSADQYGYDELGNVETLSNPRGVRSYTYDEIQRLDTETGYTGNRDHAYDLNGNRTTDGVSAPGTPTTATYTSNTNRIATLNGAAVTLDAAGQITNDGLNSYTWDDAGRLKTVSRGGQLRATYYYDHKHRRTRKVTTAAAPQGAKTLVYHYDDQDRLIAETTETGAPVRSYLWADATLLAQVEYTLNATTGLYTVSRELLFELDHLGTPRQARLNTGTAVWRWESDGYGNTLPNEDPDGNGQKTYVYLRFPGQYFDEESGLHYNWHRYYVPRLGRYLSSDPIGIEGGENTYGYVGGKPLRLTDSRGLDAEAMVLSIPAALAAALADSPLPGPGDAAALLILASALALPSDTPTDQIREPERSKRGEARCRCKAATNAEGGRGPTPQEWFYAERSGLTMSDAAREACRQANKHIGQAYPGCQGEHCHCVCSENGGPPIPYNPR